MSVCPPSVHGARKGISGKKNPKEMDPLEFAFVPGPEMLPYSPNSSGRHLRSRLIAQLHFSGNR